MEKTRRIEKSKDGVPCWDGDPNSFQEYEETSMVWEQSVAWHKRGLCGPRLANELTGVARRFILGMPVDWLSYAGGVQRLMDHLRGSLGLPQLPEMTDHLTKYFKQGRRKRGESMGEYITRKVEVYSRAKQALSRVLKTYQSPATSLPRSSTSHPRSAWSRAWADDQSSRQNQSTTNEVEGEEVAAATETAPAEDPLANNDPWGVETQSYHSVQSHWSWWDHGWSDHGWQSGGWQGHWSQPSHRHGESMVELLPDFIQGWYLLNDASLDTQERNMVLAAVKEDFSLQRIAQELRAQWSDDDLRRRDQAGRGSGWWMDEADVAEEEQPEDEAWWASANLTEEGMSLVSEAQAEAEQAMAVAEQARRTLKEARAKQHQVRMSRRYYKTSYKGNFRDFKNDQSKGTIRCLRCNGNHKVADCPKPAPSQTAAVSSEEHAAPFMCFTDGQDLGGASMDDESGYVINRPPTTKEVVEQGKAVLDGGATRTLASVAALEKIMEINQSQNGHPGVSEVDLEDRPTFGFGNSSRNQCVSTAALKVSANGREGLLRVHALDQGEGPLLFSIHTLRALGAVIDFSEDLVVFRTLSDRKVIQLERSTTGHQLLPMTSDWFEGAQDTKEPVPGLRQYI